MHIKNIIYGKIIFDDVVHGNKKKSEYDWSQACDSHLDKLNRQGLKISAEVIPSSGYLCGVQGCTRHASHYVSFLERDKLAGEISLDIRINKKDLVDQGYDPDFLTDEVMLNLANSVEKAIKDTVLPTILEAAIDSMDIPKKGR